MAPEETVATATNNAAVDALFDEVTQLRRDLNELQGQVTKIAKLSTQLAGIVERVELVVRRGRANA
jgi:ubiquinone biosynthesis protein UbiJ